MPTLPLLPLFLSHVALVTAPSFAPALRPTVQAPYAGGAAARLAVHTQATAPADDDAAPNEAATGADDAATADDDGALPEGTDDDAETDLPGATPAPVTLPTPASADRPLRPSAPFTPAADTPTVGSQAAQPPALVAPGAAPAQSPNAAAPAAKKRGTRDGLLWHDDLPPAGTVHSLFGQAAMSGAGTIVAGRPSTSIYQALLHLRMGYFVHRRVFFTGDLDLGGGAGSAAGVDKFLFNVGAAVGMHLPVHKSLRLMPTLGFGYNLWVERSGTGQAKNKSALQMDLRLGLVTPISRRFELAVTPFLQPNLVHGGSGPAEAAHVTLGVAAGVLMWL